MNNDNYLQRSRLKVATGQWWNHPWWQDQIYYENDTYNRESAEIAFSELKSIYDEKWLLQNLSKHPLASILIEEGLQPFSILYSMGLNFHVVKKENLVDDSKRRLTNPMERWESANFELKLLALFLDHGYKVERNHRSGKGKRNCDLEISSEHESIYVEIKRPNKIHRDNEAIMASTAYKAISRSMQDTVEPLPPILKPLSSKKEIEKVFHWIREATKNQLPDSGPGVVIVESPLVMPCAERIQMMADRRFRNQDIYAPLSAAVLIDSSLDTNGIHYNVNIICNPHSNVDVSTYESLKLLSSLSR